MPAATAPKDDLFTRFLKPWLGEYLQTKGVGDNFVGGGDDAALAHCPWLPY